MWMCTIFQTARQLFQAIRNKTSQADSEMSAKLAITKVEALGILLAPFLVKLSGWMAPAPWHGWAPWLTATLVYPVLEELVFRQGVQQGAERMLRGAGLGAGESASLAIVMASGLFALAHVPVHGVLHSLLVAVPSFALGILYARHRNLPLNCAAHAWWNAGGSGVIGNFGYML